jgi:uncharacterized protein YceH (UPF0502 family)
MGRMDLELDAHEARVLGVLIEKDLTTPDQYPLTLNATAAGCSQKSNRDPVLEFLEGDVYAALQKLIRKGLAGSVHPVGSRVEKFRHNAEAVLKIEPPGLAVMAELLLRGPQQPGELRARASRMSPVESLPALMDILQPLVERGLVRRLAPTPGSRAERYAHTLAPLAHPTVERAPAVALPPMRSMAPMATAAPMVPPALSGEEAPNEGLEQRVKDLEFNVGRLRRQLDNLAWKLGEKLEG